MELTARLDIKDASQLIRNLSKGLDDFRPALKDIESYQKAQINEAFGVAGKNITGAPWAKLNPKTLIQKLKSGFQSNILVRTGALQGSFGSKELSAKALKITSDIKYFPFHQMGTGRMPARQILGHSQAMQKKALDIAADYLIKLMKRG